MPKIIDNYVLEQKIGSGQFGDVFKGFHQQTKQQVAIKTIKRQTIKGKFYQLLETQIKVLKTCDNANIMKMYTLKKTANHYYLMLQYCNGGDMLGQVRKCKKIAEKKVIRYFCQILNGFQTLVKHKIMHRDFKLANILLHEDNIKIADFGFAKLLQNEDYTTTMLGSPLNMAPEVLAGNKYNSKADIWSIAACIYEMLFGKPPYIAPNMIDLLKLIKNKPIIFPSNPIISDTLKDVLKRMLVPEVKRRISWYDLFNHPINTYLDAQLRKQINLQLVQDESLMLNTSKYYLKKNLIIKNTADIEQKQQINNYLLDIMKTGDKKQYKYEQNLNKKIIDKKQINNKIQQEKILKIFKQNSKILFYHRNIYAFLATIVDNIIQYQSINNYDIISYIILEKILRMIHSLQLIMEGKGQIIDGMKQWEVYLQQPQFKEIKSYIDKQYDVFCVYQNSLQNTIEHKIGKSIKNILNTQNIQKLYQQYMQNCIKQLTKQTVCKMLEGKSMQQLMDQWKLIENMLIGYDIKKSFNNINFDFKKLHEQKIEIDSEIFLNKIQQQLLTIL